MCTVFLIIFTDILIGDKDDPDGLIAVSRVVKVAAEASPDHSSQGGSI